MSYAAFAALFGTGEMKNEQVAGINDKCGSNFVINLQSFVNSPLEERMNVLREGTWTEDGLTYENQRLLDRLNGNPADPSLLEDGTWTEADVAQQDQSLLDQTESSEEVSLFSDGTWTEAH